MNQAIIDLQAQLETYRSNRDIAERAGDAAGVRSYDSKISDLRSVLEFLEEFTEVRQEDPSFASHVKWALALFVVAVVLRLGTGTTGWLSNFFDESTQYFLTWPLAMASKLSFVVASFLVLIRAIYPNTFHKDSGTRFNAAFKQIKDPFQLILCYLIALATILFCVTWIAASTA